MKILITGGHVTPALAVIEELRRHKNINIVFIGKKYVNIFDQSLSFEYKAINRQNIRFIDLKTGRLNRILSFRTIREILQTPAGFWRVFNILKQEKPDKILSFGGHIALPVAIAAFFLSIPVFTHEQTISPGITNRIIGIFAEKIFVAFKETKSFFKNKKTIVTGNPLREAIFKVIKKPFLVVKTKPVIYVTGGSLGSQTINAIIEKLLPRLLDHYIVIHQTGEMSKYKDYQKLSEMRINDYFIGKHFYDDEIGYIYSLADLIVSRSGANTVFETIALRKPAIFIPLPWSANQEQKKHAVWLSQKGVAEIFDQEQDPSDLFLLVRRVFANIDIYKNNFQHIKKYDQRFAVQTIVEQVLRSN